MANQKSAGAAPPAEAAQQSGAAGPDLIEQAHEMTEQVQDQAVHLADTVRQQVTSQAEQQAAKLAGQLETVSLALQTAASQVRQQDNQLVARYVDNAAERIGGWSESLRGPDVAQKVEQVARQRPGLFLGGALGLGLLASRFFKTSARNQARHDQEREQRERLRQERLREAEEAKRAREAAIQQPPAGEFGGDLASAYLDDAVLAGVGPAAAGPSGGPGYFADAGDVGMVDVAAPDAIDPLGLGVDADSGPPVGYDEPAGSGGSGRERS